MNIEGKKYFLTWKIDIMANISHPSIVNFYRLLEDAKALYIVQEIGGTVSLSDFVRQGKNKK